MVCEECKKCDNYDICDDGCLGSTEPCEYWLITCNEEDYEPRPNYWGEY